jgi:hypothetical protein
MDGANSLAVLTTALIDSHRVIFSIGISLGFMLDEEIVGYLSDKLNSTRRVWWNNKLTC